MAAIDESLTTCKNCGANRTPGVVQCTYCEAAFIDDLEHNAVPCWSCKTWNEWGTTDCAKCSANLVIPCLDCKIDCPHHLGKCFQCGKAFI